MSGWLQALLVGAAILVGCWLLLIVLARRLPPGLAKDLAGLLPDCVTTVRRLRRDSRVPGKVKFAVLVATVWLLSPIDLIPEFLPVIGPLDDIVVVALVLRYAVRHTPGDAIREAWPGNPEILARLTRARPRRRPDQAR